MNVDSKSPVYLRIQRFQSRWTQVPISSKILNRASLAFPVEPVRSLDAIHLVSALELREVSPGLGVLSLDHRVRDNAEAWGFPVLPATDSTPPAHQGPPGAA